MNIVLRLRREKADLEDQIRKASEGLVALQLYLALPKFHGVDNDWVAVSTDIGPKLLDLRASLTLPAASEASRTPAETARAA